MNRPVITLESPRLQYTGVALENPEPHHIVEGINVVIGANGAGKSTLADILEKGWNFRTNRITTPREHKPVVRKIEFSDIHSLAGMKVEYYQQRYEATMNDEVPTVAEAIGADRISSLRFARLAERLRLKGVADKKINYLSSGELRKLLIINALIDDVDVLILDNPYIGLDAASRAVLDDAIDALAADAVTVVLLVANPDDVHPHTAQVLPMASLRLLPAIDSYTNPKALRSSLEYLFDYAVDIDAIPLPPVLDNTPVESVLELHGCKVKYGAHTVIDDISWRVDDCSFWALSGPNGSGKSTLLSLVCADNPQSYANDITLFGRRRGTGESIWDIKRRIAFVSPELSLHFHPAGDVATIIAQGLNDTTGVFVPLKPGQSELADTWMRLLHIEHLAGRRFNTLSAGERQMVMLARAFIKQPRLMILDEPMHGLDLARNKAARAIVNAFAARAKAMPGRFPMSIIFVSHYASEMPECITHTKTLKGR